MSTCAGLSSSIRAIPVWRISRTSPGANCNGKIEARAQQPALLILDTHLLSNMLWSQTLFGDCPAWLEAELLARHYDLHLLLSPEQIDWTDDGQRCQPDLDERLAFYQATRDWLENHHQRFQIIEGNWAERQSTGICRRRATAGGVTRSRGAFPTLFPLFWGQSVQS